MFLYWQLTHTSRSFWCRKSNAGGNLKLAQRKFSFSFISSERTGFKEMGLGWGGGGWERWHKYTKCAIWDYCCDSIQTCAKTACKSERYEINVQWGLVLRRVYVFEYLVVNRIVVKRVLFKWFNLLKPNDIYIYMSYRSANLQTLHFKYLFNKYTYWIF